MSRKTNRDHAKKKQRPMVEDKAVASQLEALLTPAITSQENYYRQLGYQLKPKKELRARDWLVVLWMSVEPQGVPPYSQQPTQTSQENDGQIAVGLRWCHQLA